MLTKPKNRKVAALLAFAGVLVPIAGLHKFYLGQPLWGACYILLSLGTPISRIASAIEGVWYLTQNQDEFDQNFNLHIPPEVLAERQTTIRRSPTKATSLKVGEIAEAVRQLDQLRQEGLITEYEFEQKRRQLLDQV